MLCNLVGLGGCCATWWECGNVGGRGCLRHKHTDFAWVHVPISIRVKELHHLLCLRSLAEGAADDALRSHSSHDADVELGQSRRRRHGRRLQFMQLC